MRPVAVCALVVLAGACGDNSDQGNATFEWNTRTPGSLRLDKLAMDDPSVDAMIDDRAFDDGVAMFYGHFREGRITEPMLDALIDRATAAELPFLTFADLANGPERRGICLSFDDDDYATWGALRAILQARGARATFFVTRFPGATADERAFLHALAADGDDIEAHSIDHVAAPEYVAEHGLDAYLADEVQPSFDVLRADGFAPVAFAYPFGATTPAIDAALLAQPGIALVRRITTPP